MSQKTLSDDNDSEDPDEFEGDSTPIVTKIAMRYVTPMHSDIAQFDRDPNQQLVLLVIGEPTGKVENLALLPSDAIRLRTLLHRLDLPEKPQDLPNGRLKRFELHCWTRASNRVSARSPKKYLDSLEMSHRQLHAFVQNELSSLSAWLRRYGKSKAFVKGLEYRFSNALAVAIDIARADT